MQNDLVVSQKVKQNYHMIQHLCACSLWLFATLWTVAHQASLSMGFSRQEYWSGLPFPPPGDLPNLSSLPLAHLGSPNQAPRYNLKEWKQRLRNLYTNVHSNIIHNSQKKWFNRWINKNVICLCNRILFSYENMYEGTSLVVQWLKIFLPTQGSWVQSLVGEQGSHMLLGSY